MRLIYGAQAVPCFFGVCGMIDKVKLVARDGGNNSSECNVVTFHPRFGILDGYLPLSKIARDTNGGENTVRIKTFGGDFIAQGRNDRGFGGVALNKSKETPLAKFIKGFGSPFTVVVICPIIKEFR